MRLNSEYPVWNGQAREGPPVFGRKSTNGNVRLNGYLASPHTQFMDKTTQLALLALRQRFITEEPFGLNHLRDGIASLLPDLKSKAWEVWDAHITELADAYEHIVRDSENIPWPEPPLYTDLSGQPVNAFDELDAGAKRDSVRAQRMLEASGVLPKDGDVGPVRSAKSIFVGRIAKRKQEFAGRNGRKPDFLADECVIPGTYIATKNNGVKKQEKCNWCIACDKKAAGHDPARIKNHAHTCEPEPGLIERRSYRLRCRDCGLWSMRKRGGSSLSVALETGDTQSLPPVRKLANKEAPPVLGKAATPFQADTEASAGITDYFTPTKISRERQAQIDLLLFKFVICCALPFTLLGNTFFLEFVLALAPNYKVPERTAFFARHIESEVAAVGKRLRDFLSTKTHITFSLDGWSSRAKDEIYTFHATIPSRRSFFVDSHIFKGVSVTGENWLKLFKSAIAGDGGPNVRVAKRLIAILFPWILNIYDPCHNLNLMMKDLGALFKKDLIVVSGLSNYFGKSNYGTHHLNEERKK
ncbi:hypothetical protein C8J57DRAFT_1226139 [Mycena rebaudengoi]|nr:hypothetical protein C8J57DRAFT_1226139 [Mycena rebaudengoi]